MAAIAILVSVALLGMSEANFQCRRNISSYNDTNSILNLEPLLSLESVCLGFCRQSNCSSKGGLLGGVTGGTGSNLLGNVIGVVGSAAGTASNVVAGSAQCILDPKGDGSNPNKVTEYQACIFPCILDLNLLDTCDVQAIVSKLLAVCPNADLRGLCISACLCCGKENETIEACVNVCLTNKGIDLTVQPLNVPALGIGKKDKSNEKDCNSCKVQGLPLLPGLGLPNVANGLL